MRLWGSWPAEGSALRRLPVGDQTFGTAQDGFAQILYVDAAGAHILIETDVLRVGKLAQMADLIDLSEPAAQLIAASPPQG